MTGRRTARLTALGAALFAALVLVAYVAVRTRSLRSDGPLNARRIGP